MSKERTGLAARIISDILALALTLCLAALPFSLALSRLLGDRALHEGVACDTRVIDAQQARITRKVEEVAAQVPFTASVALDGITREGLENYNREIVGWWMGLLDAEPSTELPVWETAELEQAVREDEAFQAAIPATQRKAAARDQVGYAVSSAVTRTVVPLRVSLAEPFLPDMLEKVDLPRLAGLADKLPAGLAIAGFAAALLIALTMTRDWRGALLRLGAAAVAGALTAGAVMLAVAWLQIPGQLSVGSEILGLQAALLLSHRARIVGIPAAATAAAGVLLMALSRLGGRRRA